MFFKIVVTCLTAIATILFFTIPSSADDKKVVMKSVVMDEESIPFVLDTNGDVWAFKHPWNPGEALKLPNLHHIKKIVPYMALSEDGHVYTWGLSKGNKFPSNPDGPDEADMEAFQAAYTTPEQVNELSNVSDIDESDAAGKYFTAVVNHSQVYEWGNKVYFKEITIPSPTLVYTHDDIRSVSNYGSDIIILTGDKTIIGWGSNNYAQLGSDSPEKFSSQNPAIITAPEVIKHISISSSHTIALSDSGHVFFWGDCWANRDAKIQGIKSVQGVVDSVADMSISRFKDDDFPNIFVKKDGSVWLAEAPEPENTDQCQSISTITSFTTPSYHIEGITAKALAVTTGGDGSATPYTIFALGADNTLWGANARDKDLKFEKINVTFNADNK